MALRFSIIVKSSQYRIGVIDAHSAVAPENEFTLYTFIILTNPLKPTTRICLLYLFLLHKDVS